MLPSYVCGISEWTDEVLIFSLRTQSYTIVPTIHIYTSAFIHQLCSKSYFSFLEKKSLGVQAVLLECKIT